MPPETYRPATYAISISTFMHQPHFQVTAHADMFLETLVRCRAQGKFALHGFAIMPDHVHLLLSPAPGESIARSVQFVKGGYSFAIRKTTPKNVWHSGYHEHRVRDLTDYGNQLEYIANNPPAGRLPHDYLFVHTHPAHVGRLDGLPSAFTMTPQKANLRAKALSNRSLVRPDAEAPGYLGRWPDHAPCRIWAKALLGEAL